MPPTPATPEPAAPDSKKYLVITREEVPEVYHLLDDLVAAHHASDLAEAKIVIAWMFDVQPDRDDHLTWGKAKKVGALERQLHDHDFVILLNQKVWNELPPKHRRALLDHELTHCGRAESDDGESRYYIRKHDLEKFTSVVRRYGTWREDVESFVHAAMNKQEPGLFDERPGAEPVRQFVEETQRMLKPGDSVTISTPGQAGVTITPDGVRPAKQKAKAKS